MPAGYGDVADIEMGLIAGFEGDGVPGAEAHGSRRRGVALGIRRRPPEEPGEALAYGVLVHHAGHGGQDAMRLRPAMEDGAVGGGEAEEALLAAVRGAAAGVGRVELLQEAPGGLDVRLVRQALQLGGGLAGRPGAAVGGEDGIDDAGVSVARLIPNRWLFLEATGQVFRGDSGPDENPLFRTSRRAQARICRRRSS